MTKEEYAIVLDYLPHGYAFDNTPSYKKTAIVQAIGKEKMVLLEAVPKKDVNIQILDEVYIGEGKRDKIHHVNGKLDPGKLTATAKAELELVIKKLVDKNQAKFLEFFNKSQPLTTRMHTLELLPGLGKKHMWEIIEERRVEPFKDFEDLKKRVKLMPDPQKIIIKRIFSELQGKEKYNLFVGK
jgi:putative nucleotide binding protein